MFILTKGSLCYAELGTSIPKSGGTYAYLLEGLGPIPAFLYAWTTLILTSPSSGAVVCLTFATYLLDPLFGECGPPKIIINLLASAAVGKYHFVRTKLLASSDVCKKCWRFAKMKCLRYNDHWSIRWRLGDHHHCQNCCCVAHLNLEEQYTSIEKY